MRVRKRLHVCGLVQGVGFRPCVFRLARSLGLAGFVKNLGSHVLIEVEGGDQLVDRFTQLLRSGPPTLARLDAVFDESCPLNGETDFRILPSDAILADIASIGMDVATCEDCLVELFDPTDRRFRYPFINCTNCGPRLTIIKNVPYDRANTTMQAFGMCPACRREYEDPANRRFHAEPIACADCGPRLSLLDAAGTPCDSADPLGAAVGALKLGRIVAVKGLGGYHLACLASSEAAISALRQRKHRDEKPLALMVHDLEAAIAICQVSAAEADLLLASSRPIVLLRRRPGNAGGIAGAVAPQNPTLGLMLPYTPLHHLLLAEMAGAPLVMTSGNLSEEPIVFEDEDAVERLAGIADCFLVHDRPIHLRCDDSIVRYGDEDAVILRRSRGFVPAPLPIPLDCPVPILAVGGQMKATFALGQAGHAVLSQHCGDLDDYAALQAYLRSIAHFERLFEIAPQAVVHDLHPDYASTRYAQGRSDVRHCLAVQHHHAHLASCLVDNGALGPAIGVIFDGTGYGLDGAIWGGEFLIGDCSQFQRAAHLRYVAMPGGQQAIREPWRMAAAYLLDAEGDCSPLEGRIDDGNLAIIKKMVEKHLNCPLTSSTGRLFDGVAALAGVRQLVSFEGQAAMELEWLAWQSDDGGQYPYAIEQIDSPAFELPWIIDTRPLIKSVSEDARLQVSPARIARRFHTTLVALTVDVCLRLREATGLNTAAVSGGVFMNVLMLQEVARNLRAKGFTVLRHRLVPPNDGGLSLGQLALGAAILGKSDCGG